jgi:hypothetical protein
MRKRSTVVLSSKFPLVCQKTKANNLYWYCTSNRGDLTLKTMARRVQFPNEERISSVVCTLPNREDFTEEDHELLWFSKADYHMGRSAAKVISRESVRFGLSKHLDDTYTEKNSDAQERLQLWTSHGDSRRGLERWANKEHGDKRQQQQFDAIMAVLEAQDELLASSRNCKVDVEKLRKVSHKATKTARHFARMMGKADSFAMANEIGTTLWLSKSKLVGDSETVATENTTRSGADSAHLSASRASIEEDENERSISSIDDRNQSSHGMIEKTTNRFRRFGFGGRNDKERRKAPSPDEARVSRVA